MTAPAPCRASTRLAAAISAVSVRLLQATTRPAPPPANAANGSSPSPTAPNAVVTFALATARLAPYSGRPIASPTADASAMPMMRRPTASGVVSSAMAGMRSGRRVAGSPAGGTRAVAVPAPAPGAGAGAGAGVGAAAVPAPAAGAPPPVAAAAPPWPSYPCVPADGALGLDDEVPIVIVAMGPHESARVRPHHAQRRRVKAAPAIPTTPATLLQVPPPPTHLGDVHIQPQGAQSSDVGRHLRTATTPHRQRPPLTCHALQRAGCARTRTHARTTTAASPAADRDTHPH